MELGMVGLGRMGANMASRLLRAGHRVAVFDRNPPKVQSLVREGAIGAASLAELVGTLAPPRAVWLMVPAAVVDDALTGSRRPSREATRSSTAATRTTATTSVAPVSSPPQGFAMSTWERPAAFGEKITAIAR